MKTAIKLWTLGLVLLLSSQMVKANHQTATVTSLKSVESTTEILPINSILVSKLELDDAPKPKCTASANLTVSMSGVSQTFTVTVTDHCRRVTRTLEKAVNRFIEALEK